MSNIEIINKNTGKILNQYLPPGIVGNYLPLAGGSMDPFPSGVITAHNIQSPLTDNLTLQSINNQQLNLTTTNNASVNMLTGSLNVNALNGADIKNNVKIHPTPLYSYPNNPDIGLKVYDYLNPTGFQQIGCEISNINSLTGEAEGVIITNVKSGGGSDAIGIRVDDIGLVPLGTNIAKGTEIRTINSNGIAHGIDIQGVNGPVRSYGIQTQNINSSTGNSVGYEATNISGDQDGRGAFLANINGVNSSFGLEMTNMISQNGKAYGVNMDFVQSNNNDADGLRMNTVDAVNGTACGIRVEAINGNNAIGLVADTINAVNQANGFICSGLSSSSGNAEGLFIRATSGSIDTRGILVDNVTSSGNVWGAEFNNMTGNGDAKGILISGPNSLAGNGVGVEINSVSGSTSSSGILMNGINSGTGAQSKGIDITNVNGDANAVGVEASIITAFAAGSDSYGFLTTKVESINRDAYGLSALDVRANNTGIARGLKLDTIQALGTGRSLGIDMSSVSSTGGPAVGVNMSTIQGPRATGIDISSVTAGTSQSVGVRVGNVTATTAGQPAYAALLYRGLKAAGDAGQLMRLADGNLGLAIQTIDAVDIDIDSDGGNFVIITAGAPVNINLVSPVNGFQNGHWFLITKVGGGGHIIQDTNLADAFNAQVAGAPFAFGGPAFGMILMFFNAGIWYAHVF